MTRVRGESVAPGIAVGQVFLRGAAGDAAGVGDGQHEVQGGQVETHGRRWQQGCGNGRRCQRLTLVGVDGGAWFGPDGARTDQCHSWMMCEGYTPISRQK